jgi:hypothetical protein
MEPPLIGRRFSMIVSEEMLAQIGARGLEHAAERLGQEVAYRHQGDIQKAVDRYLFDGSWLRPIIEDELRRMAREFVLSLWSDDEKKNLRDWFDVFTAKCRNPAAAHETPEEP